jgi:GAF domain-containing protein
MSNSIQTLETQLVAAQQRMAELESHEAEHQRTAQIQTALYRIAEAASAAEDMREFYAAIHQIVGELMYAKNFYIALYDHARQMINFPYYVDEVDEDIPDPNLWEKMGLGEASGITAYALRTGQPRLLSEADYEELARQGQIERLGITSPDFQWLGVPLQRDERTLGVLVVQHYGAKGVHYTEKDLNLLIFVAQHIATALERARLLDETRRLLAETEARNNELAIINNIQQGLAAELEIQAIYDLVGDQLRDIFDAQVVLICTFDHEAGTEHFNYNIEKGERFYTDPRPIDKLRRHLIDTRQVVLINENFLQALVDLGFAQERVEPVPGTELPKSILHVPLLTGETVRGYVSLQNIDREHAFSDSDVRLLTTLANSMSVALESARHFDETQHLLKETQERNSELAIINSISEGLVKQLDFQAIIDLVGDKIRDIFAVQVVTISLYNPSTKLIHHRYVSEHDQRFFFEKPQALDPGRLAIIQTRRPLIYSTRQEVIEQLGTPIVGKTATSYIGVPIILGSEVTGVITVQDLSRQHLFDESDVRLLSTLAATMGVALENARLFAETTRLLNETEERNSELAIINNIQQALAAELDMQAIYDLVGDQVRDLFDAQVVIIATFDHETGREHFNYLIEKDERFYPGPRPINKLRRHLIDTRRIVWINENYEQGMVDLGYAKERVRPVPGTELPKSVVFVPLLVGETVRGLVSLQNIDREQAFSASDVRLLTTLANSMSVALENVRLFETEQAQARQQAALFRLSAALAAATDEAEICRQVVAGLQDEALGYAFVGVFLLDPATGERVEQASTGWTETTTPLRLIPGQGLSERAVLDGQLHYTPDVTQAADYVPTLNSGSEADVPLKIGQEVRPGGGRGAGH